MKLSTKVTAMLATSKNVLLAGHNHLLTTITDDPSLVFLLRNNQSVSHQHWWLAGSYDLKIWIAWWLHGG